MVNLFFVVILSAIFVQTVLGLVANLLNLRSLKLDIPAPLDGIYRPEEYKRSQEYTRATTRFGFVTYGFRLLLLLAFWFSGGFNYLDQFVRSWGFVPIVNGLIYIGILAIGYSIITIPFSLYGTFVIEERFGFNKTTLKTFWVDKAKGLVVSMLIGAPLLAGVLAIFEYGGPFAWVYCWLGVIAFSVVMQVVVPVLIMPIFNKFTPMEPGELRQAILDYAGSVRFPVENVFVMDGSKRSTKSNAFFTGFGRAKRVALFDTLIQKHTVPELVAVVAHEVGHYKKKHILQGMLIAIVESGIVLFLLSLFLNSPDLYAAFSVQEPSVYTGLIFFALLFTPLELVLSIGTELLSRRNEYEADRFAAQTTANRHSLADALKKLSADNYANLTPHPFYVFLYYSHPPLLQRVRAIEATPVPAGRS